MATEPEELEQETNLLEDVRAAAESLRTPPEDKPETTAPIETAEQTAERERDEAGRFKAKTEQPREKLTLNKQPVDANTVNAEIPKTTPDGKPILKTGDDGKIAPVTGLAPPMDWMGDAKIRWGRLDKSIQEEILKREEQRAAVVSELAPLKELFDTNREFLVNQAGSVVEAQRQMMQFARMSVDNPVQLAEHILRARGLDPRAVFSGQPGQAPAQNQPQDVQTLLAQLVDQRLQPFLAQTEQQQTQQIQSTIDQFASRPDRPYFNDVRSQMGVFLKEGSAKTMDEAYEMATWANPTIRAALLSEQAGASGEQRQQTVNKARLAGRANLKGSPLPNGASVNGGKSNSSVLDDVRAAAEEMRT